MRNTLIKLELTLKIAKFDNLNVVKKQVSNLLKLNDYKVINSEIFRIIKVSE